MFYTYVWKDSAGVPFYVGKGNGKRAFDTTHRSKEFKEIHVTGYCSVEIVDEFFLESEAHAHEVELIASYGRREFGGLLINKTDGGEGTSGITVSKKSREKMSLAHRGRWTSEARSEASAKTSAANVIRYKKPEARAKMSAVQTLRYKDQENIDKLSAAQQRRYEDHGERIKLKESQIKRWSDEAARDKARLAQQVRGPQKNNTSGFIGVSMYKPSGKWIAFISINKKHVHLGTFQTPESAALARDKAALDAWGAGNCYLNFPEKLEAAE